MTMASYTCDLLLILLGVRRGRDRMVVGFILRLFRQLQYIISNVFLQHVPVSCNNFVKIVYHFKFQMQTLF